MRKIVFIFLLIIGICEAQVGVLSNKAMVVSAREEASKIGIEIIQKGGNAFDAMVATELALAVVYPYAGNISGGGFMVYRLKDGSFGSLDYREKAPLKASKNMYLDNTENVIPKLSTHGALSVGVPGTIAGIFEVHEQFGTLPIKEIMLPVIALAKKGIVVTPKQLIQINTNQKKSLKLAEKHTFAKTYQVGDTIKYLALASTLERILKNGKNEFYNGETALKMVQFLQSKGGIITLEDLELYKPVWRNPIVFNYKKLKIISMAPPSSGGITLAQIMKMIEPLNVGNHNPNQHWYVQMLTEAERRAYADRNYYLGDPDFVSIPVEQMLNETYLKNRMSDVDFYHATPSSTLKKGEFKLVESNETTHYSIVDSFGNAVSVTTTLNGAFGSKLYDDELGFFYNNQMDDFSAKPGVPNSYGLIGAEANSIAPQKRMLSSMTPTIIEKEGKLFMVLGTPGGSTIITSVLQTILNVYEFNMTMQEAVSFHRFHHQWLPDEILMEPNKFLEKNKTNFNKKGYHINEKTAPVIGKVDAILVHENGYLEGGADPRGDDTAIGL